MKKSRNEGKIETTSSFTRWSIRAQRGSWHTFVITEIVDILRWRFRRIAHDPSPVAVSRVGHSSEPNEEEPCRRPGKTRFPGNCTRVRNPAAATKVAVDRGFPLLLAHCSCALGPQVLPVLRIISWFLAYRPSLATRDFSDKEIANFQMDFFLFFFNVNSVIYKNYGYVFNYKIKIDFISSLFLSSIRSMNNRFWKYFEDTRNIFFPFSSYRSMEINVSKEEWKIIASQSTIRHRSWLINA